MSGESPCRSKGASLRSCGGCPHIRLPFTRLFEDAKSRSEIVATFLAVLELSKTRRILLEGDGEDMELTLTNEKGE